jgi:hypothetical protein
MHLAIYIAIIVILRILFHEPVKWGKGEYFSS